VCFPIAVRTGWSATSLPKRHVCGPAQIQGTTRFKRRYGKTGQLIIRFHLLSPFELVWRLPRSLRELSN
jgi:hypothetical protein